MNYSEKANENGVVISNLNGILFSSMMIDARNKDSSFTIHDLNKGIKKYAPDTKPIPRMKNKPKLNKLLEKSNAKPFLSLQECAAFQYKLMQEIADQL